MSLERFQINNIWYTVLSSGIIRQETLTVRQIYDIDYVISRYDSLLDHGRGLSLLRAGFILGTLGYTPRTVLDIGYGNGDFLHVMQLLGSNCYGYDISKYPLPANIYPIDWKAVLNSHWSLISFFDSLEHFSTLDFLPILNTQTIVITAPWMPDRKDFSNWKHRRPGEHIYHFMPQSLTTLMRNYGYVLIRMQSIEDMIRISENKPNTFTAIYRRT
jgi:hypothetical protein